MSEITTTIKEESTPEQGTDADEALVRRGVALMEQVKRYGPWTGIIVAVVGASGTLIWNAGTQVCSYVGSAVISPVVEQQVGYIKEQREALKEFRTGFVKQTQIVESIDKSIKQITEQMETTGKKIDEIKTDTHRLHDASSGGTDANK